MKPFDRLFDTLFTEIGIEPERIEKFLSSRKSETRIAANAISIARVVLGYFVIHYYETCREKKDKKGMAAAIILLTALLTSDSIDGYLCRKAHIENSKSGRVIDSLSDVALRLLIARSSILDKRSWVTQVRALAELGIASSTIPDVISGVYSSTNIGKTKIVSDSVAVIASMLLLRRLSSRFFLLSAVLALADAVERGHRKRR